MNSSRLQDLLPREVLLVDVAPRDGLQNESRAVETADKVQMVNRLAAAGVRRIESTSFVSPRAVPQLADAADVMAQIERVPGVEYAVLVPNLRGMHAAIEARADIANVVVVATETFNQRNVGMSVHQSMEAVASMASVAQEGDIAFTAVLGAAFSCPFEGPTPLQRTLDLVGRFVDLGIREITLADTIGTATPGEVAAATTAVLDRWPHVEVGLHLHDTRGQGLSNGLAAITAGAVRLEASTGGIGGCPFAPGASGNAATEDLAYMLEEMGVRTGVDIPALVELARFLESALDKKVPSRLLAAGFPTPVTPAS